MDFGRIPEAVKGIGYFFETLAVVVLGIVTWVARLKHIRKKAMDAIGDPPQQPPAHPPQNPFGAPPLTSPELRAELSALQHQVAQSTLAWHVSDLRRELADVRRERDDAVDEHRRTAAMLAAKQLKLEAYEAKIATLEQALAENRAERARAIAERELEHLSSTAKTPLRPRAR